MSHDDVAGLLDTYTYDSIFVVFDRDRRRPRLSVDASTNGATYASMLAYTDTTPTGPNVGEAYIHEWLHPHSCPKSSARPPRAVISRGS